MKKTIQIEKKGENDAERRLTTEMKHQMEEAETRALAQALMKDVKSVKANLDSSSFKLLNNFQGISVLSNHFLFAVS